MEICSKYPWIFSVILIYLAILLFLCLLRAVKGPTIADRLMAGNMMGTMVMVIISILALYLGEGYLVDICLIYAMISFLAVVVLTKVYTGVYLEKKEQEQKGAEKEMAAVSGQEGEKLSEREEHHGNS